MLLCLRVLHTPQLLSLILILSKISLHSMWLFGYIRCNISNILDRRTSKSLCCECQIWWIHYRTMHFCVCDDVHQIHWIIHFENEITFSIKWMAILFVVWYWNLQMDYEIDCLLLDSLKKANILSCNQSKLHFII